MEQLYRCVGWIPLYFYILSISPASALAQDIVYISVTKGDSTEQEINQYQEGELLVVEVKEDERFSKHYFCGEGTTQKWMYRDEKENTEFVAEREGNAIYIQGILQGEKIEKTIAIDQDIWINKIDHGLSHFVNSDQTSVTFWTLKLADLEPVHFEAEKIETEMLQINGQKVQAIKVKLTLNHMLIARFWSAHLWYRTSDGLFLRYEGANGGPGTPVTTITIAEGI